MMSPSNLFEVVILEIKKYKLLLGLMAILPGLRRGGYFSLTRSLGSRAISWRDGCRAYVAVIFRFHCFVKNVSHYWRKNNFLGKNSEKNVKMGFDRVKPEAR